MEDIKKILVATRSTKDCENTVELGVSLARKYGAKLYIMDVMTDPFSIKGWNLPISSLHAEYEHLVEKVREDLDRMVAAASAEGVEIKKWVQDGDPVEEIVKVVEAENIDLLVLTAHKEWRLEHFLFGRTNHEIVRRIPCSVLLAAKGE